MEFLPWNLDKLVDDLVELDLTNDENLRKSVTARYFLHWAVLSLPEAHPDCIREAKEAIGYFYQNMPQVPWCTDRLTIDELHLADKVLGEIYC